MPESNKIFDALISRWITGGTACIGSFHNINTAFGRHLCKKGPRLEQNNLCLNAYIPLREGTRSPLLHLEQSRLVGSKLAVRYVGLFTDWSICFLKRPMKLKLFQKYKSTCKGEPPLTMFTMQFQIQAPITHIFIDQEPGSSLYTIPQKSQ
jgi:hypothetical protein